MNSLLFTFLLVPLAGYLLSLLANNRQESLISWTAISAVGLNLLGLLALIGYWGANDFQSIHFEGPRLYHAEHAEFAIDLFFDGTAAVFFFVASVLTLLDIIFSRYYIHREKGFKRYFNNIILFYLGLAVIIFSGNFETLFIGWEIIGITSFFLIAFYRERYLPVKNALKVVSIFRVADILILLGIWACHHYFKHNVHFFELEALWKQGQTVVENPFFALLIPLIFLVTAMVKSAQWPFSSWLPRAMEGPTTSSAIFYGSMSVHMGVFLLLRTYPFWAENWTIKTIIIVIGAMTGLIGTFTARVQSTVKTQIAYSSVAQIGIMFIEVALGWRLLALVHFTGNAFLRTYQLLVSPSVLSYLIHDQFFNFIPPQHNITQTFWGKLRLSVYVMSIKEWKMDTAMYYTLWRPLKIVGGKLGVLGFNGTMIMFVPLYLLGLYFVYHKNALPFSPTFLLPEFMAFCGLCLILMAFTARYDARRAWVLVMLNQLFITLAIGFNEQFDFTQIHIYLSGILVCGAMGFWVLYYLSRKEKTDSLDRFQGHQYEHPRLAVVFLIACLGLAGFPITPTFIGEDLMLSHISENQTYLTLLTALSLIVGGLAIFRMYARVFLGPHEKGYHEVAYRSS